jgi:hypothetical protein
MRKGGLISVIVLLMAGGVCLARTITVDDDGPANFDNIQAAINDANDGDTVLVKDGTYTGEGNHDIDFLGKAITVKSKNGPENCVIDCEWEGRGFHFGSEEGVNSVLDGLTITKGRAPRGGGIYCEGSSPTITNCTISENQGFYSGGIHFLKSSATVENCILKGNDVAYHYGSGPFQGSAIYCEESNIEIMDSILTGNSQGSSPGGAIGCERSDVKITNCSVSQNDDCWIYGQQSTISLSHCDINENSRQSHHSSGIFCIEGSTLIVSNCTVGDNINNRGWHGAVGCHSSRLVINNSIISGNIANSEESWGGGITLVAPSDSGFGLSEISNCLIAGNVAKKGGAIASYCEEAVITNCTISGNTAEMGASIFCGYGSVTASNCVMWGNTAQDGSQIYLESSTDYYGEERFGTLATSYSDVEGGLDAIYVEPNCVLNWGLGNIDADPCFVMAGYWDVNDMWVDGDYHLLKGSPCIDTGDPNYAAGPNETDLDGMPRIYGPRIDMGAYEYVPPVEVEVKLTPQMLNCDSKGKWLKAHVIMPEEIYAEDIDVNTPAVAEPVGVESEYIKVSEYSDGSFDVQIYFDRQIFCEGLSDTEGGLLEVTVTGFLTDGRKFEGSDTIMLKAQHWRRWNHKVSH